MNQSEQSLFRKIGNLFARGIVRRVDDKPATQTIQATLMADETRDNLENAQPYGFTSVPLSGAECITIFFSGNRDHGSTVSVFDKRYRPKDQPEGSVCVYDASGTKILLKNDGTIEITASTVRIIGDLEVTGDISAEGDITDQSATSPKTMSGMRAAYNIHTHPDAHGGNTGTPNTPML